MSLMSAGCKVSRRNQICIGIHISPVEVTTWESGIVQKRNWRVANLPMYRKLLKPFLLLAFAIGISAALNANAQSKPSIILGTTTSTQDSGLLDVLVPRFEKERRIDVKVIAVGSGAALRMAERGDVDVVLVHSPI